MIYLSLDLNEYIFQLNLNGKLAFQTVFHIVSYCLLGFSITIRLTNLERTFQYIVLPDLQVLFFMFSMMENHQDS